MSPGIVPPFWPCPASAAVPILRSKIHTSDKDPLQFSLLDPPAGRSVVNDIGVLLRSRIASHLGPSANVTLIDTIPVIRTAMASSQDHIQCRILAQAAVDAAFAGGSKK